MGGNKWRASTVLFGTSLLFLLLYLLDLPYILPAALLPLRTYVALSSPVEASELRKAAEGSLEAFAVLPDALIRLPGPRAPEAEWAAAARRLPERPILDALFAELERPLPALRRLKLVVDFVPFESELARLRGIALAEGLPIELSSRKAGREESPVESLSFRTGSTGEVLPFELLLSERAVSAPGRMEIEARYEGRGRELGLWQGEAKDMPRDRVLRLSAAKAGLKAIVVRTEGGRDLVLGVPAASEDSPRVLEIGRPDSGPSIVDSLYPTRRTGPGEAAGLNLADYELVVVDGIPLTGLGAALERRLVDYASRREGSLLFAADSPEFGRKGDSPALEEILPVTLLAPSLKDLPDMGILILLDDSGSMFGGKLSLAKVASLELLKGLKRSDRIGLMLFSDRRRWVWNFQANSEIVAAPVLDPVEAEGGTELALALGEGIAKLSALGLKERHIVVISDGVTRPADFEGLAAQARAADITISTMGVGEDLDRPLLEKLARMGGGRFYRVASAEEIPSLIFEDRRSQARPHFGEGVIPILDLAGTKVATIDGMAQYSPRKGATVLFTNDVGDPLFAEFENANRAVMLFASDLHGGYTSRLFRNPAVVAALHDRFEALFSARPADIAILETSRGLSLSLRSGALAAPSLRLSRQGATTLEIPFVARGAGNFFLEAALPVSGAWRAALRDRGTTLASFGLSQSEGLSGVEAGAEKAREAWKASFLRTGRAGGLWLLCFFALSLATTLRLRMRG